MKKGTNKKLTFESKLAIVRIASCGCGEMADAPDLGSGG